MAKSRKTRHKEKRLERTRQKVRDLSPDTGYYLQDNAPPELERAVREEFQTQDDENSGAGAIFSDPRLVRRDLALVRRVVASRLSLGLVEEGIPKELVERAIELSKGSKKPRDVQMMLRTLAMLSKHEIEYLKFLGHGPVVRVIPNANPPRRPEDGDVVDSTAGPSDEPFNIAFQENASDEQLAATFAVAEQYGLLELLRPAEDDVENVD